MHVKSKAPLAFALVWIAFSVVSYAVIVTIIEDSSFDFFPRWYGARAALQNDDNPYSSEVSRRALAEIGYGPHHFLYPANIIWTLLPFWLLPFPVALSVWMGLQLTLSFALPGLVFRLLGWKIGLPDLLVIMLLSTLGFRHTFNAYVLGQFIIFVLSCLVLAWWALGERRTWPAVFALVAAPIRPEAALMVVALLLLALWMRRFRVVGWWAVGAGGIFALTLAHIGFWIPDFFAGVDNYQAHYTATNLYELVSPPFSYAVAGGMIVWALWLIWQTRTLPDRMRLAWGLSAIIVTFLLVSPQSKPYTMAYALFPIWLIWWAGRASRWNGVLLALILVSPWPYLLLTHAGFEAAGTLEPLLLPVVLSLLLTHHHLRMHSPARARQSAGRSVPNCG